MTVVDRAERCGVPGLASLTLTVISQITATAAAAAACSSGANVIAMTSQQRHRIIARLIATSLPACTAMCGICTRKQDNQITDVELCPLLHTGGPLTSGFSQ